MPLLRRLTTIFSASLNDLVEQYEDPEKMLRQAIREIEQAVCIARDRAVTAIAQEKLLSRQVAEQRQLAELTQRRAGKAVLARDDAGACLALRRRFQHEDLAAALEEQHTAAAAAGDRLRQQLGDLQIRLAEAKRRLTVTAARARMAEARGRMIVVESRRVFEVGTSVERWLERLEIAEAQADASSELTLATANADEPKDFEERVDQELAALKERASNGP